jgi:hypothetical protein
MEEWLSSLGLPQHSGFTYFISLIINPRAKENKFNFVISVSFETQWIN